MKTAFSLAKVEGGEGGGQNLNKPVLKSSNAQGAGGEGGGKLKLRIDQHMREGHLMMMMIIIIIIIAIIITIIVALG